MIDIYLRTLVIGMIKLVSESYAVYDQNAQDRSRIYFSGLCHHRYADDESLTQCGDIPALSLNAIKHLATIQYNAKRNYCSAGLPSLEIPSSVRNKYNNYNIIVAR